MKKYIRATSATEEQFANKLFDFISNYFEYNEKSLYTENNHIDIFIEADVDDVYDAVDDFISQFNYVDEPIATKTDYDKVISGSTLDKLACVTISYDNFDASSRIEIDWIDESDLEDNMEMSQCSFDFDLGDSYDQYYLENELTSIFESMDLSVEGIDFRSVDYPGGRVYSQCGIDFKWVGDYDAAEIEEDIANLIEDEGGNFLGIDFNSYEG